MNDHVYDLLKWSVLAGGNGGNSGGGGGEEEVNVAKAIIEGTITEISDDTLDTFRAYAFYYYASLKSISLSKVTTLNGDGVFQRCSNLETIDFPELTTATGSYIFSDCNSLRNVNLPKLKEGGGKFFSSCVFESIVFPALETTKNQFLWSCAKLKLVDFHVIPELKAGIFSNCPLLDVVILRKMDRICTLQNIGAFSNTPFASGGTGGTVYVPQALITRYQNATNWSTLYTGGTCNFVAIEGSEYE